MAPVKSRTVHYSARESLGQETDSSIPSIQDNPAGSNPTILYVSIACGVVAFLCLLILIGCICCLALYYRRRKRRYNKYRKLPKEDVPGEHIALQILEEGAVKREKTLKEKRDKARIKQESEERGAALEVTSQFSQEGEEEYKLDEKGLMEIGSRLHKHWFKGHYRDTTEILVTEAPLTKQCCLQLNKDTLDTINRKLLLSLRKHSFIHPIIKIHYNSLAKKVLIVQPLVTRGSLRDYIYQQPPLTDWSKKYGKSGRALSLDTIGLFGSQVLDAIGYLYRQGFVALGHVHTGNIFVITDSHCKLGGYENTLLGYRTRSHKKCIEMKCLQYIDNIMFGHVVYEMSSGKEIRRELFPEDEDYHGIEDKAREIVQFIFAHHQDSFNSIMSQWYKFFSIGRYTDTPLSDSQKVKRLLEAVASGGVVRQEDTPIGKFPQYERTVAREKVDSYLEHSTTYQRVGQLPDIGRRLWKYWYKIRRRGTGKGKSQFLILSISVVPDKQFASYEKTVRQYFTQIKHPYLLQPVEVQFVKDKDGHHVILIQELMERGSLRDRIHATVLQTTRNPLLNWTEKLQSKGSALDKIALYGKQILEAMSFLYQQGFPPLGHVHAGNIFMKMGEEVCCLGGHENMLLGYETCQKVFAHRVYSDSIDLRMFGHVMYEMSTGRELDRLVPLDSDYELVKGNREKIRDVISFIFSMAEEVSNGTQSYKTGLQEVQNHIFFSREQLKPQDKTSDSDETNKRLLENLKQVFDKVNNKRKGPRGVKKALKKLGTAISIS